MKHKPCEGLSSDRQTMLKGFAPQWPLLLAHPRAPAQDLQFLANIHTVSNRNRPAKQVGGQRWLNQHSLNRGSTRTKLVLCAVSASPECLMNHGELRRLRTGSPAHCPRPSGPGSTQAARPFAA